MSLPSSLSQISTNTLMQHITDYSDFISRDVVNEIVQYWPITLEDRTTRTITNENGEVVMFLDLCTLMRALCRDHIKIEIPEYQRLREKSIHTQQINLKSGSYGECLSMISNQEVFTFNVRTANENIAIRNDGEIDYGAYRNYSLTNVDGDLYSGWKTMKFEKPEFFKKYLKACFGSDVPSVISFDYFVHQSRWMSFYGYNHFLAKCLIDRLSAELSELRKQKKALIARGLRLDEWGPAQERAPEPERSFSGGDRKNIDVLTFQSEVDYPTTFAKFSDRFPQDGKECLRFCCDRIAWISPALDDLRFMTRVNEYAFSKKNPQNIAECQFPNWFQDQSQTIWERKFKTGPKSRTEWNRMHLCNDASGVPYAIRYRWLYKSISVQSNYNHVETF